MIKVFPSLGKIFYLRLFSIYGRRKVYVVLKNDKKRSKQTLQMTKNAKKKGQNDQNY